MLARVSRVHINARRRRKETLRTTSQHNLEGVEQNAQPLVWFENLVVSEAWALSPCEIR